MVPFRKWTSTIAAAIALAGLIGCSSRPPDDPQAYVEKITAARAAKDAEFRASNDPIPDDKKAEFLPLAYFPVDPSYNVLAGLKPATEDITLMMPTSTGVQRKMRRVGTMEFTLKGQQMSLIAFNEVGAPDMNHLTLMFSDMTSGTETYAAGRYIDLERTASDIYALDFNLAITRTATTTRRTSVRIRRRRTACRCRSTPASG
jgi:uncharacterized protein (DUF1684 family)